MAAAALEDWEGALLRQTSEETAAETRGAGVDPHVDLAVWRDRSHGVSDQLAQLLGRNDNDTRFSHGRTLRHGGGCARPPICRYGRDDEASRRICSAPPPHRGGIAAVRGWFGAD